MKYLCSFRIRIVHHQFAYLPRAHLLIRVRVVHSFGVECCDGVSQQPRCVSMEYISSAYLASTDCRYVVAMLGTMVWSGAM